MRSKTIGLFISIWLLLAAIGCQAQPHPAPTTTPPPTPTSPPDPSDLTLIFPDSVILGEAITFQVENSGDVTYIFYTWDHPDDLCVPIRAENGRLLRTFGEVCDVGIENQIAPGETRTLGRWDTQQCADGDCLTRQPAPTGSYFISAEFYIPQPNGETTSEQKFSVEKSFVVKESE